MYFTLQQWVWGGQCWNLENIIKTDLKINGQGIYLDTKVTAIYENDSNFYKKKYLVLFWWEAKQKNKVIKKYLTPQP